MNTAAEAKRQQYFNGLKEGRIVYFRDLVGRERPAIVTHVFKDAGKPTGVINCVVFMDDTMCTSFRSSVLCDIDSLSAPGTWHWMFEGQNTRYQPDRTEQTGEASKSLDKVSWGEKREKS